MDRPSILIENLREDLEYDGEESVWSLDEAEKLLVWIEYLETERIKDREAIEAALSRVQSCRYLAAIDIEDVWSLVNWCHHLEADRAKDRAAMELTLEAVEGLEHILDHLVQRLDAKP